MFERFTDRARRTVVLAQEEARLLNHDYIGTEHVLLGLLHERESIGPKILLENGITLEKAQTEIVQLAGQGQSKPTGHIPFTPTAKKSMELSLREALQMGHNWIGTEHLLLGLVCNTESIGLKILGNLGFKLDISQVRKRVFELQKSEREATAIKIAETCKTHTAHAKCMDCGTEYNIPAGFVLVSENDVKLLNAAAEWATTRIHK